MPTKLINVLLSSLLATAVMILASRRLSHAESDGNLVRSLPKTMPGWDSEDRPVATTPEMQRAVDEMLNYDEAVFRTFRKGALSLSVYAAYWTPGKFHPRLIAVHCPDVCWVANGMQMTKIDSNYQVDNGAGLYWHAQYREFVANGRTIYVLYWHVMNGKLSGYAEGPGSSSKKFLSTSWSELWDGIGAQYFIRVSSESPPSEWENEPLFRSILEHFRPVLAGNPTTRHSS